MAQLKEGSSLGGARIATVDDLNNIELQVNSGKSEIASAIREKGSSASDTDTFIALANAIRGITTGNDGKRTAFGSVTSSSTSKINVRGLAFRPGTIIAKANNEFGIHVDFRSLAISGDTNYLDLYNEINNNQIFADGFEIGVYSGFTTYTWFAYEQ